jgi:hypothetical protein
VKILRKKGFMNFTFQAKKIVTFANQRVGKKKTKEKQNIEPMRSIIYLEGHHMHHMYASSLGLMVTLQVVVAFNMSH